MTWAFSITFRISGELRKSARRSPLKSRRRPDDTVHRVRTFWGMSSPMSSWNMIPGTPELVATTDSRGMVVRARKHDDRVLLGGSRVAHQGEEDSVCRPRPLIKKVFPQFLLDPQPIGARASSC